jgi:hypothetical protein
LCGLDAGEAENISVGISLGGVHSIPKTLAGYDERVAMHGAPDTREKLVGTCLRT